MAKYDAHLRCKLATGHTPGCLMRGQTTALLPGPRHTCPIGIRRCNWNRHWRTTTVCDRVQAILSLGNGIPLPCPLPVHPAPGTGRPRSVCSLHTCHPLRTPADTTCFVQTARRPSRHNHIVVAACASIMVQWSPARPGCAVHVRHDPYSVCI
jgi:hypothetical protein